VSKLKLHTRIFCVLWAALGCPVAPLATGAMAGAGEAIGPATGFFRLAIDRGRQFLVTPQGHAFVALGLNHCSDETTGTPAGQQAVLENLRQWGFNAGDYGAPAWMRSALPHPHGITLLPNSAWMPAGQFGFRDVFDPRFLAEMERTIRAACEPQRDNPLLIGYFFTDVPRWSVTAPTIADESLIIVPEVGPQNWLSFFKTLPEGVPGRLVWEQWRSEHPREPEESFLPVIARQLYREAHRLVRKYDPHHLIFGERYHEYDMPEAVVREALPYIDALAIQTGTPEFDPDFFTHLARQYDKPIYLCDHVSSFPTGEFARTMGQHSASPGEHSAYYRRYVTTALSHPAIIGYNRCQYRSRIRLPGEPPLLKQGLLQLDGRPYAEVVESVTAANRAALAAAYADRSPPGTGTERKQEIAR